MSSELVSRILYCDSNCVVVNKIAGEACEGAGQGMVDLPKLLALSALPGTLPPNDALALPTAVHRLDVPVSGCALFARTGAALRFLTERFRSDTVKKYYWGIIEKPQNEILFPADAEVGPFSKAFELIHWIQFDPRYNKSVAYNEPGSGRKKAILRYRLAGSGRDYLFLEIELVTGRHHQIRAQFERLGLHIKGDLKYGARRSERNSGIRLHARSLSFPDPADNGKCITVQADPPLRDNLWLAFEESQTNAKNSSQC
jgi:23S rRNA pseudouridine1911/1915/1917 synthase